MVRLRAVLIKGCDEMAELTFETAMARLEEIVAVLESGNCTLDESLKLFEEGTKLTAFCSGALKTAEQKILQLTQGEDD
jgi:exodeoxyribonuclease VII small subunit